MSENNLDDSWNTYDTPTGAGSRAAAAVGADVGTA